MHVRVPLILRLLGRAFRAWQSDNAPRLGAALAYYTLFAIAPVLLVAIGIAGLVFGEDAVRGQIVGQLSHLIGTESARTVQSLLESANRPKTGRFATIIGSVTFLLAASGAFLELQAALNTIWRVKPHPGSMVKKFVLHRLRSFGLVVVIGFLLLVSLAVSAALAGLNAWLGRRWPGIPTTLNVLNVVISLTVITGLFAALYRILPDVQLRWRDVGAGAFFTAVLFTLGKQLIGIYLGQTHVASSFGAAGSVVVILVWVYYSAQIVLLGAEFTRVYTHRKTGAPNPEPFAAER